MAGPAGPVPAPMFWEFERPRGMPTSAILRVAATDHALCGGYMTRERRRHSGLRLQELTACLF